VLVAGINHNVEALRRTLVPVLQKQRPGTGVDGGCNVLGLDRVISLAGLDERHFECIVLLEMD